MANQLGMAKHHTIVTFWKRGWSHRRIARTLGIHHVTVSRYVRLVSEAAIDATGPSGVSRPLEPDGLDAAEHASRVGDSKPAISIAESSGRCS